MPEFSGPRGGESGGQSCETKGMRETIDLPEPHGSRIQPVMREAIVKGKLELPLIHSSHPGSLRSLTNAEVDDLLG